MRIHKVTKEDWETLSKNAHLCVFGTIIDPKVERIDFALVADDETGKPMAYVTCREMGGKAVYWQYGGAFPETKDTILSFRAYNAFVEWTKKVYDEIFTYVENTNIVMLKMAMKVGFRISGIRQYKEYTLVEHILRFP